MTKPTSSTASLPLVLAGQALTRGELVRMRSRYEDLSRQIEGLQRSAAKKRADAGFFLRECRCPLEDLDEAELKKYNTFHLQADQADAERAKLETEFVQVNSAIAAHELALRAPAESPSWKEVARHFQDLKSVTDEIAHLRTHLDEQLTKAGAAEADLQAGETDSAELEDAKAAVVLGEADGESKLKALEARRSEREASATRRRKTAATTAADARASAAGLKRRLDKAEQRRKELRARTADVAYTALHSQAAALCEMYCLGASELLGLWTRLTAIDQVMRRFTVDPNTPVFAMTRRVPRFPAFNLKACETYRDAVNYSDYLTLPEPFAKDGDLHDACERELAQLREAGWAP